MLIAFKLALSAAVLLMIAWKIDFSASFRLLSTISGVTIVSCLALLLIQMTFGAARIWIVISMFGYRVRLPTVIRLTLEALFFSQAFISFIGGDAYRIWRIHRMQVPLSDATSIVVLDRLAGFTVNHLVFVGLLPLALAAMEDGAAKLGFVALALGGLGGIALLLLFGLLGRRMSPIELLPGRWRTNRVAALLIDLTTIARHVLSDGRNSLRIAVLAAVMASINCMLFYIVFRSWGVADPLAFRCAALVPGIMEISLMPISVAGWGLREGASVIGFGALGLESEIGLAASVAYGLMNIAIGLLGGLLWLFNRFLPTAAADRLAESSKTGKEGLI